MASHEKVFIDNINKYMTKIRSITDIAALYEAVRTPQQAEVVEEKNQKFPKGTFPQSTKEVKATTDFENSGPNAALEGEKKVSKKTNKKKKKSPKKHGKVVEDSINSFMKSEFDKLFENVMGDDESSFEVSPSMGPEGGEPGDAGLDLTSDDDMGGEDVTVTMPRDVAQQLVELLQGVLGDEGGSEEDQELEDLGIDMESEDEGGESGEDENSLNDSTEMSELSDSQGQKLMSKGSMKAPGTVTNKTGGKASHTTATDKQGNETKGHPMDKESELTKAGNHKVASTKTNKPGGNLFA